MMCSRFTIKLDYVHKKSSCCAHCPRNVVSATRKGLLYKARYMATRLAVKLLLAFGGLLTFPIAIVLLTNSSLLIVIILIKKYLIDNSKHTKATHTSVYLCLRYACDMT